MKSCPDGLAILRKWKTAETWLLFIRKPSAFLWQPSAIVEVSEQSLVLKVGSRLESFDLMGAKFRSLLPDEIAPEDLDRFALTLEVSLRDGGEFLLVEELPPAELPTGIPKVVM